jgi:hypothetical protein
VMKAPAQPFVSENSAAKNSTKRDRPAGGSAGLSPKIIE